MPRLAPLTLALSLVLASLACAGSESGSAAPDAPQLTASWQQGPDAPFPGSLAGQVVVPPSGEGTVTITLRNARFTTLPAACRQSTIVRARSLIVDGNARLRCELANSDAVRTVRFGAVAVAARGDELGGTVRFTTGSTSEVELPAIVVDEAPTALTPRLRLVSSPDFLNADVGDLRSGPGFWNPRRSPNGINKRLPPRPRQGARRLAGHGRRRRVRRRRPRRRALGPRQQGHRQLRAGPHPASSSSAHSTGQPRPTTRSG